jgi:hypothetical protein
MATDQAVRLRQTFSLLSKCLLSNHYQEHAMLIPMKPLLIAAALGAAVLATAPTQAATAIGTMYQASQGGADLVQKVHWRPYRHFHRKRFIRRNFRRYGYYRPYRYGYYRPYRYGYYRPYRYGLRKYRRFDD